MAPDNGLIKVDGILKVGRMVKFNCKPGFMMEGQPVMTCSESTENGIHIGKTHQQRYFKVIYLIFTATYTYVYALFLGIFFSGQKNQKKIPDFFCL